MQKVNARRITCISFLPHAVNPCRQAICPNPHEQNKSLMQWIVLHFCHFYGRGFVGRQVPQLIRFDNFELDVTAGELRKGGIRLRLQDQPLLVLRTLLECPGEVVTREQLQKRIWPADTFVDFDHGVHAAVNRLRAALNDAAENPRYVETVGRRGYRFIGRLQDDGLPSQRSKPSRVTEPQTRTWNSWTGALVGFAIALVIAMVLLAGNVGGVRDWLFVSRHPAFHSLAVLPLGDLTHSASQDYFADGMTEELITQISKLGDLKVISHTSVMQYQGTKKTIPQIAGELHVDAVVEGAVERVGNRVRITAQLVNATTDQQIWADSYDRELSDVLVLQSEVAEDVAKQIDLHLTSQQQQRLHAARQVNPDAHEAYLLGRYYWNSRTPDGLQKSGKYFAEAIKKDPNFALAYSGQADYFAYLSVLGGPEILKPKDGMTQARASAEKALELDDSLAEAHASLGNILHNYDWNWQGAEREYQKAIELNPNYATAHHLYAHLLIQTGRMEQSIAQAERALELDPYSPFVNNGLARQYYLSRQYDKAIARCQVGLQINPAYLPARIQLALAYEQTGKLSVAIAELEKADKMLHATGNVPAQLPVLNALLGHAYALAGRKADAQEQLKILQNTKRYIPPSYLALVYMALGDKDKAFSWLDQGVKDRSEHMLYLGLEPLVDPLRSDKRFNNLLREVGLPVFTLTASRRAAMDHLSPHR